LFNLFSCSRAVVSFSAAFDINCCLSVPKIIRFRFGQKFKRCIQKYALVPLYCIPTGTFLCVKYHNQSLSHSIGNRNSGLSGCCQPAITKTTESVTTQFGNSYSTRPGCGSWQRSFACNLPPASREHVTGCV